MSEEQRTDTEGVDQVSILRRIPAIEQLASSVPKVPHAVAVEAARVEVSELRGRVAAGEAGSAELDQLQSRVIARATRLMQLSLRPVINATGVVLHTNLGRAPLPEAAIEAVSSVARGYSNLEYELESGARGSRQAHVAALLCRLSGSEAAIAVNNNAAAVTLAIAAVASGRQVAVSRGELVEIGDSFRIPEILESAGAELVEVGTTNRTRASDYERAITPETAALLRVHQSNFRTVGFTGQVELGELSRIALERGTAVIDDLGSGAPERIEDEPTLRESVAAGADLVCCSADKLLGGPQAGIIVGRGDLVERCRRHPLARAFRLDKLQLAALEATLSLHLQGERDSIPVLAMLSTPKDELADRAARLAELVGARARVGEDVARVGGGALPLLELEGPVCEIDSAPQDVEALASRLRRGDPPVVGRIARGRFLMDPRTITTDEVEAAAAAARRALD